MSSLLSVGRGVPSALRLPLLRGRALIGGRWVEAASGETFPVVNPANGELIAHVPDMEEKEASTAIEAAHTAQLSWAARTCKERSAVLRRWCALIEDHNEELAKIVSLEGGKVLQEARVEIAYSASLLDWFSEEAKRLDGDILPLHVRGKRMLVAKQPVGVAALITPWNSPNATVTRKAGAALAAGCSVVLKPSEETPFSALALGQLAEEAGVPPGVFNVVTSSADSTPSVGTTLCTSPLVSKVSFTGSTAVGRLLMRQAADSIKRVSLELGGNAPVIVFNSADLDQAVAGTIATKYRHNGQICICANRILVQSGIHDQFVERFVSEVARLVQGDPLSEASQQGPLINEQAMEKVEDHVTDAVSKGAEVLLGGARNENLGQMFFSPSVVIGTNTSMKVTYEETFGPLAAIMRFDEEEEAIFLANDTSFGLAGYFFTGDMGQTWRVSEALEVGMVGVNETAISSAEMPFGGIKQSGIGREGSKYGLDEYLNLKYICMGGIRERIVATPSF